MQRNLVLGLVGIVLVGGAVYFFRQASMERTPLINNTEQVSPTSSPDTTALEIGGNSYLDPNGVYGFLYPNDYSLDTQDSKYIRIFKRGEQQRPQSEMSDGVIMVFETVDLSGKTLEEFVDTRITESTADGTSTVTQPKQSMDLNTYPGFMYKLRGLGESTFIVIQKNAQSNQALVITYAVMDPQGNDYQSEVDAILSTVKLEK